MFFRKRCVRGSWLAAAGLLLAVGCSTIRSAHDAQDEVAARGDERALKHFETLDLRSYSLEQLVAFAMTNRPSVVSARLAVEDARLALKEIAADAPVISDTPWTAPHVYVNGAYAASSPGTQLGGGADFSTSGKASFGLSLELLVYDFGRYGARAKAQAERIVAAEQTLVDQGFLVFGEICVAYFDFVQSRSLLDVALKTRDGFADQLARAEAMLNAGEAHQLDVLRAKVDLANSVQDVVAASNSVETAGATFMYALGIDVARGTSKQVFDMSPIPFGTVYNAFPKTDYTVETAYELSRTNSPEMRLARARLRAASHDVDYAIANMMPTVSASTSFSWSDPLWYWTWGASAVQSVFEGFRKTTAVDRAVVAMKTAAANVDACEQKLSSDLQTAIAVRDNAGEGLKAAIASALSAYENLDMVQAQYSVGDASRIDLSAAVSQYSPAVGDCIQAFYYRQKAEAALYAISGTPPAYDERKLDKVEVMK